MKNVYRIPIHFKRYNRRVSDKAVTFFLESKYEVPSTDMDKIDSLLDGFGVLLITDENIPEYSDKQIKKMLEDMPRHDTQAVKSPSKRLRNVLWVKCKQNLGRLPTDDEFLEYYSSKINSIIDKIKLTLE